MTKKWQIGVILCLSIFLRFYQLEQFAGFDFDQELAVTKASEILSGKLTLIGQEVSVGGIFIGPFYNYVTAILLFISRGDPAIIYYFQALIGVVTTWLIFDSSNKIKPNTGFIAALIYAVSYSCVYIDKTAAPTNWLLGLTALSVWVSVQNYSIFKKLLFSSLIVGFTTQLHPSGLSLVIIPLWWWWQSKTKIKDGIIMLIAGCIFMTPLVIFDIRHDWLNWRGLSSQVGKDFVYPFVFRLIITAGTLFRTLSLSLYPIFPVSGLMVLLIYLQKKLYNLNFPIWLLVTGLMPGLVFSVYSGKVVDYYFLPSVIILILGFSYLVSHFSVFWKYAVVVPIVMINIYTVMNSQTLYSLYWKKQVISRIAQTSDLSTPVRVHLDTDLGQNNGFKYLSKWQTIPVEFTHIDPNVSIYIPESRGAGGELIGPIRVIFE